MTKKIEIFIISSLLNSFFKNNAPKFINLVTFAKIYRSAYYFFIGKEANSDLKLINLFMSINPELKKRNQDLCELCNTENATIEYTVTPKSDDSIHNQVALCNTCFSSIDNKNAGFHWRCLEGSIWSQEAAVQTLSYRILYSMKDEEWANALLESVDYSEDVIQWALSAFQKPDIHKDAFGNVLENGDNVVLTQSLNVKGTNFTASKGTVVKKIKLVHDNPEQIEGKINEQMIVILTKFVKKG